MKRKIMKLQLNRETLRNLSEHDLKDAAGGVSARRCSEAEFCITDYTSCDCTIPSIFNC